MKIYILAALFCRKRLYMENGKRKNKASQSDESCAANDAPGGFPLFSTLFIPRRPPNYVGAFHEVTARRPAPLGFLIRGRG